MKTLITNKSRWTHQASAGVEGCGGKTLTMKDEQLKTLADIAIYVITIFYVTLLIMKPAEVFLFSIKYIAPVVIVFILAGLIVNIHRFLRRKFYPYKWLVESICYPYTRWFYKRQMRYLSIKDIDKLMDKLVQEPDSWYIRRLIELCAKRIFLLKQ